MPNYLDIMKRRENAQSKGLSLKDGLWRPHKSVEKGYDTIGYGHKLGKSRTVTIGGKKFNAYDGLTQKQVDTLLEQDFSAARTRALAHVKKGKLEHIPGLVDATASLLMNIKPEAWKISDAKKALERGDIGVFLEEAFGKEGFNKITNPDTSEYWSVDNKKFSKGLGIRRADELSEIDPMYWVGPQPIKPILNLADVPPNIPSNFDEVEGTNIMDHMPRELHPVGEPLYIGNQQLPEEETPIQDFLDEWIVNPVKQFTR